MWKYVVLFLKGAIVGLANVIPGVSGGTMAVVMDIYTPLIESLNVWHLFKNFKKDFLCFLLPIVLGAGVAIFACGSLMDYLFTEHLRATLYFFTGIILASVPTIYTHIGKKLFHPGNILCFLIGAAVMVASILFSVNPGSMVVQMGNSITSVLWYILCGFIATITMIIPGISGSLVMTIIGVYPIIMEALHTLNLWVLLPFAVGMVLAFIFGTRLISYLLNRFTDKVYSIILGLVVGSVPAMLFNRPSDGGAATFITPDGWSILFLALGFALCLGFSLWEIKRSKAAPDKPAE